MSDYVPTAAIMQRDEGQNMPKLLGYETLNACLDLFRTPDADSLRFIAECDGKIRLGTYSAKTGWYVEVSNFQVPRGKFRVDYCDEHEDIRGLYRFFMGVNKEDIIGDIPDFLANAYETADVYVRATEAVEV